MGNKHYGSYTMSEADAREEAQKWVENGGHVREDYPHGGNDSTHLHLYDDTKSEDFVINYERGTGYDDENNNE
jgi:hypothetical protein